jgi:S-adenosylmethionine synthetase
MAAADYLFTSESVAEGHPDKVCDRISDEIVDLFLAEYPYARVACETLATTNRVVIAGEVRPGPNSKITADLIAHTARMAIKSIGYEQEGFHWHTAKVDVLLHEQSPDIAAGVDAAAGKDEGAGDQGIMFGYACRETPELMPAPIRFAHDILHRLADDRRAGKLPQLGPDAKSQVTLRYVNGGRSAPPRWSSPPSTARACRRPRCARSCGPTCWRCCPRAGCAPSTSST